MQTSLNIKEPGLNVFPLGVERYVVNGGGLTGIQILPDDEIEIINDEGNQICEITVFNKDGKSELGILNLKESKNSCSPKQMMGESRLHKLDDQKNNTEQSCTLEQPDMFSVLCFLSCGSCSVAKTIKPKN